MSNQEVSFAKLNIPMTVNICQSYLDRQKMAVDSKCLEYLGYITLIKCLNRNYLIQLCYLHLCPPLLCRPACSSNRLLALTSERFTLVRIGQILSKNYVQQSLILVDFRFWTLQPNWDEYILNKSFLVTIFSTMAPSRVVPGNDISCENFIWLKFIVIFNISSADF